MTDCGMTFRLALYERNAVAADQALARCRARILLIAGGKTTVKVSRAYLEGLVARMKGDAAAARPPLARRGRDRRKRFARVLIWPDSLRAGPD